MNEKKHIDRLFQEKFKNFEATPDDTVWQNIQKVLHKDKPKRRVIPIWWWTGGVAAALILLFALRPIIFSSDPLPENNVVDTDDTQNGSEFSSPSKDKGTPTTTKERFDSINNTPSSEVAGTKSKTKHDRSTKSNTYSSDHSIANNPNKKHHRSHQKTLASEQNAIVKPTHHKKPDVVTEGTKDSNATAVNTISEMANKNSKIVNPTPYQVEKTIINKNNNTALPENSQSIEEAIAKANPTIEEEKEEQPNRWNISPNVAPVYFNSLGKGSTIHSQFVNNSKSGEIHMSYGISGSYAISDRVKIRAGVNKVDLGYRTNEVMASRDVQRFNMASGANTLSNINFNNQARADAYMSISNINNKSAPQFLISNPTGTLEQQFGYIEVPLEVEYSLINKKFGLNVIGGFSTLFLSNNNVYSILENQRSLLGDANNINETSYSANLGLGINYNLSSTLKLNIEPMFKYQLNTFNNTSGDFRPYFIGIYSGFSFKF